jgi:DNA-binding transcriptional MerR regulator
MKLKEVCERTGITKRNIHYYVKEGLLVPRKELGNGYYEFSEEDCDRLLMIRSLRNAGFSILQIRSVLKNMIGFQFSQHKRITAPQERLDALSEIINRQIKAILE